MNISYVTTYNALDIHNWSGTGYNIANALKKQNNEIEYIGNLVSKPGLSMRIKAKLYEKILNKSYDFERTPLIAKQYARQVESSTKRNTDVIFSPGTIPISLLNSNKPKVFYTDATFAGMIGFYDSFSNLSKETLKYGNYLEQQALSSSKLAIYSSDWAAKTAIENYKVDSSKIKVVPFGANINYNIDINDIKTMIANRSTKECNLLFLGVEWDRKGGDIAVRTAAKLNEIGLKTTLHIAGASSPFILDTPNFVKNYGFISKSNENGKKLLNELFAQCHFLILPTRAEAFGIVFCEANSFGLPCVTTNIGGIPTIVKDNINGKTFPLTAKENKYAEYIQTVFADQQLYKQLALSSFNEYISRLNWEVSGKAIANLLKEII